METNTDPTGKGKPGRKGLTAEQVHSTADLLIVGGVELTNLVVKKIIGGSYSTIGPLLRQWRAAKRSLASTTQIPEMMVKALEAHAKAACSEADKRWRIQMDAATADAESLEEESHRLLIERDALVQEVASIRSDRDSLSGRCTQQETEIERGRVAEAAARAAELEAGVNLGKAELERNELLRHAAEIEREVDIFRRQHSQTLIELNATKIELATYRGRLEIITDRMFDPPSAPAPHVVQAHES
ncbi:chromosome segregation ATPase [Polaromonas sp. CG_9.5]|uniref:DNA-binding protein n=1 Tax=Polaromonas sp. CG_9.5 TaxID=3071705 RepID=UPI002DFF5CA4|nr:chromosome segregation ATPase [Polaromonas sp. CG_9.5]